MPHTLVVAEESATIDILAGGRRGDIGLGRRGYQHYEFERLGLDWTTARARRKESVRHHSEAFIWRPFTYERQAFRAETSGVPADPYQKPHSADLGHRAEARVGGGGGQRVQRGLRARFGVPSSGASYGNLLRSRGAESSHPHARKWGCSALSTWTHTNSTRARPRPRRSAGNAVTLSCATTTSGWRAGAPSL